MMITVCEPNKCAGCMACVDICSQKAICIQDSIKSYNAVIDEERCVNCNACRKVCQVNNTVETKKPLMWKQGWASNGNLRQRSSSGGAAAAIAEGFVKNGGILCSCCFSNGVFGFEFEDNANNLNRFTGSKYVKSNPAGIYKKLKELLRSQRKVLFIGLPCQVAAVRNYVGNDLQSNLYTIDLICHGSPSPRILSRFLKEKGYNIEKIQNIDFRSKGDFALHKEKSRLEPRGMQDLYTYAFLTCMDYTDNCYSCKYAKIERVSDISIGDSWGSKLKDEAPKGISLILCQTEKGKALLKESNMILNDVDQDKAIESNHQLSYPSVPSVKRDKFIGLLQDGRRFDISFALCHPKVFLIKQIDRIKLSLNIWGGANDKY